MLKFLILIYTFCLRLYPRPFQEEFGAEMVDIFEEELVEAAAHGRWQVLRLGWRELRDWPLHCFQAHWRLRQPRLAFVSSAPPSWLDTVTAVIPFFLFALLVTASTAIFMLGQATGLFAGLFFSYGFVFLLLLVITAAWWRGWPVWTAAWLGFLFFALLNLFVPGQFFSFLGQPAQMVLSELVFQLLWLAVLYVLLVRWPRSGMLAMLLPFGITWIFYLEFVPEGVQLVVMAVTWVWLGLAAIVLLRWQKQAYDVWLLYVAALVTGLIYVYAGHFLTEIPVRDGTLASMGEHLLSEMIPALIPLVGILLLHTMHRWSLVNGRVARKSYRILLFGVLLAAAGLQFSLMLSSNLNIIWPAASWFVATAVLLCGCLLVAVGVGLLFKNQKNWSFSGGRSFWLLIVLLLFLPILVNGRWLNILARSVSAWEVIRLTAILWLLLAAWLIGRFRQQMPPDFRTKDNAPMAPTLPKPAKRGEFDKLSRWQMIVLILALFLLAALLLPTTTLAILFPNNKVQPFDFQTSFPLFLIMTLGFVMMAVLIAVGFQLLQVNARNLAVVFFCLSALMSAAALRNFYWLAIWDSTYDGLGMLWLFIPIMGVFGGALLLMFRLPRWGKMAAFFYLLLLPPGLLLVTERASHVDFYQLTEFRARRVNQAIERYYARHGYYPDSLDDLSPRYLLSLSEPMIIFGQDWCYEGGGNKYQFGFVFREHWSSPDLVGHLHSGTNEASITSDLCRVEINRLLARDPQYYGLRSGR